MPPVLRSNLLSKFRSELLSTGVALNAPSRQHNVSIYSEDFVLALCLVIANSYRHAYCGPAKAVGKHVLSRPPDEPFLSFMPGDTLVNYHPKYYSNN